VVISHRMLRTARPTHGMKSLELQAAASSCTPSKVARTGGVEAVFRSSRSNRPNGSSWNTITARKDHVRRSLQVEGVFGWHLFSGKGGDEINACLTRV